MKNTCVVNRIENIVANIAHFEQNFLGQQSKLKSSPAMTTKCVPRSCRDNTSTPIDTNKSSLQQ